MRIGKGVLAGSVVSAAILGPALTTPAFADTPNPGTGGTHTISTPNTAGGLPRDAAAEGRLEKEVVKIRAAIKAETGGRLTVVSAVYGKAGEKGFENRPPGVVFIGGSGAANSVDPDKIVQDFSSSLGPQETVTNVDPGPGGGKAVCLQGVAKGGETKALCVWATTDSIGVIVPDFRADTNTVAGFMAKMRPDLESTGH